MLGVLRPGGAILAPLVQSAGYNASGSLSGGGRGGGSPTGGVGACGRIQPDTGALSTFKTWTDVIVSGTRLDLQQYQHQGYVVGVSAGGRQMGRDPAVIGRACYSIRRKRHRRE